MLSIPWRVMMLNFVHSCTRMRIDQFVVGLVPWLELLGIIFRYVYEWNDDG